MLWKQLLAWCVHFYTALGLIAAGCIAVNIYQGTPESFRLAFLLMLAATVIDATDGTLARWVKVKEVLPGFDGRRLDDLIDFQTYTSLPLLLIWRAGLLPAGQEAWLLLPLLASAYGFCQVSAKTEDGYFLGFPSYWNVIAFYLYMLEPPPLVTIGLLAFFAIMTFVPARYLYPTHRGRLNRRANELGAVWCVVLLIILLNLPDQIVDGQRISQSMRLLALLSLAYPVFYLAMSWWITARILMPLTHFRRRPQTWNGWKVRRRGRRTRPKMLRDAMIYQVTHTTTYDYSEPVSLCQNLAHLTPRPGPRQVSRDFQLDIHPIPAVMSARADYFGNPEVFFIVQEPHRRLTITASHLDEVSPVDEGVAWRTMAWEEVRQRLASDRSPPLLEACEFVFDSHHVQAHAELAEYALVSFRPGRPMVEAGLDLTRRIHADFRYDPRATSVTTPVREVFANRRGVCQDFAHLEIACLRSLGLAARYVSGYLSTTPPPNQKRLVGADASHAWISMFSPESGWIDLDPTNDQVPSDRHILLAWGRDYDDVSPIKGVILGGGTHKVAVAVDVALAVG